MKKLAHKRKTLDQCKELINNLNLSLSEKNNFKEFLTEYISGRITKKRGTNPDGLAEALFNLLKISLLHIKKIDSEKDIKKFYDDLFSNKIKTFNRETNQYNGLKPYSLKHKTEIIAVLKRYLAWRFPKQINLVKPLDIIIDRKKPEPEFLSLAEIERVYNLCNSPKQRYIIASLFSSGARAEEFLNFRICDFDLKGDFIKVNIRIITSKTQGRNNSLYWPECFKAIPNYLNELKAEGYSDTDLVLKNYSYGSLIKFFQRIGKKAKLPLPFHPHLLRDSCATWLASKLNRQQLCIFFGWNFSSNMPDRYISRAGVNMREVDDKIKSDNILELKNKFEKEKIDAKMEIENLKQTLIDSEISKKIAELRTELLFKVQMGEINPSKFKSEWQKIENTLKGSLTVADIEK